MHEIPMKKIDILIIICLFFISFLIRVLGVSNVSIYHDEPDYLATTLRILANDFVPTYRIFEYYPPFFSYIAAVVTLFFGGDLNNLRMISVFFGSLTVPLLYLFGTAMYDRRTGLLSALFMSFSAYHSLFSRLIMQEAFTLFFIIAFLYFFWLSQHSEQEKKARNYAILAGAMLGLSFDAKYISIFLVPAITAYLLWTNNFNFKILIDKKMILMYTFTFLFILPLLISWYYTGLGLDPLYHYSTKMFELRSITKVNENAFSQYSSPIDLFSNSVSRILEILAWGSEVLGSYWKYLFLISTFLIISMTLFLYFFKFIRKEKKSSFLMILFLSIHIFLLFGATASKYRLIYAFPLYFIMFSHITIISIDCLKKEKTYKNIYRMFFILFIAVFFIFYFITGVTSYSWDKGEYSWSASAVEYIKNDAAKSNLTGKISVGVLAPRPLVDLDFSIYSNLNVSLTYIFKLEKLNQMEIDLEKINKLKPNYLIMYDKGYAAQFKEEDKKEVFKDYTLVFRPHTIGTIPYTGLVFKRKNIQPIELLLQTNVSENIISKDRLSRSLPKILKVGRVYTAVVQIKNTIGSHANFSVELYPEDISVLFVDNRQQYVSLDANSVRNLKFKIIAYREHIGGIPITVEIKAKVNENEEYRKVDSISDVVYVER